MNSYDKINYKLRTQKRIERALMIELINKFSYEIDTKLNYVGMGSLYFTDFIYFNKNCDLDKMYSIEYMIDKNTGKKDENKEKRFKYNKPLDKISLIPKLVSEAIDDGDIPLCENNYIWYDYDGSFIPSMIDDLVKTLKEIKKSSLLAISYNSLVPWEFKGNKNDVNTKNCVDKYKKYMIGTEISEDAFIVDRYADTVGELCENLLRKELKDRNELTGFNWQLFRVSRIIYQDGVRMLTYIWAIVDCDKNPNLIDKLKELKIYGEIDLTMQNLTLYEKVFLDKHCDKSLDELSEETGLEEKTIERYFKYAKYIPEFTEIVL